MQQCAGAALAALALGGVGVQRASFAKSQPFSSNILNDHKSD